MKRNSARPISSAVAFAALTLLACIAFAGCATIPQQGVGDAPTGALTLQPEPQQADGYEQPPVLDAKDLLPLEDYAGDNHKVDDRVINDGWTNHFLLHSDYGEVEAIGAEMLRVRVNEVRATAALAEMSRSEEVGDGLKHGVTDVALGPFRAIRKIFRNPLYAVAAVPSEIFRAISAVADAGKLVHSGFDRQTLNDLIGFSDAEEHLARELGVDPETTNLPFRRELNEAAKGYYAGKAPVRIASSFIPGAPVPRLVLGSGGASLGKGVDYLREQISPRNRRNQFREMDIPRADRRALRDHPWISSHRLNATMNALHEVEDADGRGAYLLALRDSVDSEDRAHHAMRTAQLIRAAHLGLRPVKQIVLLNARPVCIDDAGGLIVPVYGDHLAWTEEVATWFAGIPAALGAQELTLAPDAQKTVLVSGDVSHRAAQELEALGCEVIPRAFDRLEPEEEPEEEDAEDTKAQEDSESAEKPRTKPTRQGGRYVRPR